MKITSKIIKICSPLNHYYKICHIVDGRVLWDCEHFETKEKAEQAFPEIIMDFELSLTDGLIKKSTINRRATK